MTGSVRRYRVSVCARRSQAVFLGQTTSHSRVETSCGFQQLNSTRPRQTRLRLNKRVYLTDG